MSIPRLRHNILALGTIQAANYFIPFLALPYLARVLGVQGYGHVIWVQTVMLFGALWVDFGFNWSATREVSAHRHDVKRVAHVFANTWAVQWILALVFMLALWIWLWIAPADASRLYWAGAGIVLGQVLLPMWLFQGLEAIRAVALIQLLSKLLTLPLVFLWVKGPDDQFWALMFFSASSLIAGAVSVCWIHNKRVVLWCCPDRSGMWQALRGGAWLFSSRALISIYTTLVPLAVGWWGGATELAYFNMADKLKSAVQALMAPVSQALFPRMSWLFQHDKATAVELLRKSALAMVLISGVAGGVLWIGASTWITLLGGDGFEKAATVLRWLAFVPCLVALSNIFGIQLMLPLGMNRSFTFILGLASGLCFLFLNVVIGRAGGIGAAQLVLAVECTVTVSMAVYLWAFFRL